MDHKRDSRGDFTLYASHLEFYNLSRDLLVSTQKIDKNSNAWWPPGTILLDDPFIVAIAESPSRHKRISKTDMFLSEHPRGVLRLEELRRCWDVSRMPKYSAFPHVPLSLSECEPEGSTLNSEGMRGRKCFYLARNWSDLPQHIGKSEKGQSTFNFFSDCLGKRKPLG